MRNTLICTLGTSLFTSSIDRKDESHPLRLAKAAKNWQQLALELLQFDNSAWDCGAEINSITSICKENLLDRRDRILFLVSDTEVGKQIGEVLKYYYQNQNNSLHFSTVEVRVLEGLRDDDVHKFQHQGLKNLVIEISKETQKFSAATIAINATGGYKAQISFAGMIGQALEIPVYYLFEKFSKVIQLPPQPVALDLSLWLENYSLFEMLETEQAVEESAFTSDELALSSLETLLDKEEIEGVDFIALSAMGLLFHERCRSQFHRQQTVLLSQIPQDLTDPKRKSIQISSHHGEDTLKAFAKQICGSPYIKSVVRSLDQNCKRKNCIRKTNSDGTVEFGLTWTVRGLGLFLKTTGRTLAETNTIAIHLEQEYKK